MDFEINEKEKIDKMKLQYLYMDCKPTDYIYQTLFMCRCQRKCLFEEERVRQRRERVREKGRWREDGNKKGRQSRKTNCQHPQLKWSWEEGE